MCRGPVRRASTLGRAPRVAIISGSFGAGHDVAAREIAVRLGEHGVAVDHFDIIDLYPRRVGHLLKAAYFAQLRSVPTAWRWLLAQFEGEARGLGRALERLAQFATGRTLNALGGRYAAVVSTHPLASQTLGRLRQSGRIEVPVLTYLTDLSVHPLWVHQGVDLHLAIHQVAAGQARDRGAARVHVVQPAVGHRFDHNHAAGPEPVLATQQATVRSRYGLPLDERLVLITGGSEGVGELLAAALDVRDQGLGRPVVLCGHNDGVWRQAAELAGVSALGWVQDMPAVLSAVDVVVQNAGGSTALEALASGRPVVSYRCLPGHGETNAAALAAAGLAPWARSAEQLAELLGPATDGAAVADIGRSAALAQLRQQRCVGTVIAEMTGEPIAA